MSSVTLVNFTATSQSASHSYHIIKCSLCLVLLQYCMPHMIFINANQFPIIYFLEILLFTKFGDTNQIIATNLLNSNKIISSKLFVFKVYRKALSSWKIIVIVFFFNR